MKHFIKQQLKKNFPHVVAAFHEYRTRQNYKEFTPRRSPFGFDFIGTAAMQDGTFEPEETHIINSELADCDVFIDIGANVGYFTCLARSRGKNVIAVEPLADNLNFLYANLRNNDWSDVEVFPLGLAEKPGIAEIYGGGTGASLISGWAGNSDIWKRTIALSTLDVIIGERFSGNKLLIKIDVEGFEHSVLKGAFNVLRMNPKPTWLIEICLTEHHPDGMNPNFSDIFELFWSCGYKAITADKHKFVVTNNDIIRWVDSKERNFGFINFIFK